MAILFSKCLLKRKEPVLRPGLRARSGGAEAWRGAATAEAGGLSCRTSEFRALASSRCVFVGFNRRETQSLCVSALTEQQLPCRRTFAPKRRRLRARRQDGAAPRRENLRGAVGFSSKERQTSPLRCLPAKVCSPRAGAAVAVCGVAWFSLRRRERESFVQTAGGASLAVFLKKRETASSLEAPPNRPPLWGDLSTDRKVAFLAPPFCASRRLCLAPLPHSALRQESDSLSLYPRENGAPRSRPPREFQKELRRPPSKARRHASEKLSSHRHPSLFWAMVVMMGMRRYQRCPLCMRFVTPPLVSGC